MFCSLFSSQKYAQFLVFSGTCKSCDLLLPYCWFLYCTLCSLSTEFSGNSKQGLYFHCKVQAFTFYWSCVEIIFRLFSMRTTWNGKERKILRPFFFFFFLTLKIFFKNVLLFVFVCKQVCCYSPVPESQSISVWVCVCTCVCVYNVHMTEFLQWFGTVGVAYSFPIPHSPPPRPPPPPHPISSLH